MRGQQILYHEIFTPRSQQNIQCWMSTVIANWAVIDFKCNLDNMKSIESAAKEKTFIQKPSRIYSVK